MKNKNNSPNFLKVKNQELNQLINGNKKSKQNDSNEHEKSHESSEMPEQEKKEWLKITDAIEG